MLCGAIAILVEKKLGKVARATFPYQPQPISLNERAGWERRMVGFQELAIRAAFRV
jgi:hypothetical protein